VLDPRDPPYRGIQAPIADIAALTGVVLDQLLPVDRLRTAVTGATPPPGSASGGWVELRSLQDVAFTG
jgi:hypothetical protein